MPILFGSPRWQRPGGVGMVLAGRSGRDRPSDRAGHFPQRGGSPPAGALMNMPVRRLNWGCGPNPPADWINAGKLEGPGIQISRDILDGLPLEDDSMQYVVSIHALQDLPYLDVVPALRELRRVLEPGGVLRLS